MGAVSRLLKVAKGQDKFETPNMAGLPTLCCVLLVTLLAGAEPALSRSSIYVDYDDYYDVFADADNRTNLTNATVFAVSLLWGCIKFNVFLLSSTCFQFSVIL